VCMRVRSSFLFPFFFHYYSLYARECVRVNSGGTGSLGDLYNKETIGQYVKKLL
jgi:hypothetical protein